MPNIKKLLFLIPVPILILSTSIVYSSNYNIGEIRVRTPENSSYIIGMVNSSSLSVGISITEPIVLNLPVTIKEIIEKPEYIGQTVTLSGTYLGWESGYGAPPITRSDWVLSDGSGAIYISGAMPKVLKYDAITITGVVSKKDNVVYIKTDRRR